MENNNEPEVQADEKPVAKKTQKVSATKKKAAEKSVNNTIEINPTMDNSIREAKVDTVVLGWGRMNPITTGHEKLANKVTQVASQSQGIPKIYLSHSTDPKKNPLSYNDKVSLAQKAFGKIIVKSQAKTIIQVMQELERQHKNVVLIVGSDRVGQFETLLNKYNGKDYTFDSIKVVSAGERDPDADDVSGMSASKMRAMAAQDNRDEFKKGLPAKLKRDGDKVFDMVRAGMQLAEELESEGLLDEAVLSYAQRRKRGLVMRKFKNKIALARKRSLRKAATMDKLKSRARKKAINIIRQKIAGNKGANYANLSPGEKMMIDKRVAKKKAAIDRIAKRMIPTMRKLDMQRLASKGKVNEDFEAMFEETLDEKKFHEVRKKDGTVKLDKRFRAFREKKMPHAYEPDDGPLTSEQINQIEESELGKARDEHKREREQQKRRHRDEVLDAKRRDLARQAQQETTLNDDKEILDLIDKISNEVMASVTLDESKVEKALMAKAEKSGISVDEIFEIYTQALEEHDSSYAFDRVNAHIAEGINDPGIFKVVFLAGGPGSGKSFIVGKTALTALGLKLINSDDAFEAALNKVGLKPTPEDIFSVKGQEVRGKAKALTALKQKLAMNGRLGLIIDGTGKDYLKIATQSARLRQLGYDTAMIFVNTDLETAQKRNAARERTLPADQVEKMWKDVQKNIGKFQNTFDPNFIVVDNSDGANYEGAVLNAFKKMQRWVGQAPKNAAAKKWIRDAKAERGIKEEAELIEAAGYDTYHKDYSSAVQHAVAVAKKRGYEVDDEDYDRKVAMGPRKPSSGKTNSFSIKLMKNGKPQKKALQMQVYNMDNKGYELNMYIESVEDIKEGNWVSNPIGKIVFKNKYKKAVEVLNKILARKAAEAKEQGFKGIKHAPEYYAARVLQTMTGGDKLDARTLAKMATENAGEEGTPEVTKKYKKDTPYQPVNEEVTQKQIKDLEVFADRLLNKFGIDVEFTRHFADRMNDTRNNPAISVAELQQLFKKIAKVKGKNLKQNADTEVVLKDMQKDLNLPVVINYKRDSDEFEVVNKTIMRKKNFATSNKTIEY